MSQTRGTNIQGDKFKENGHTRSPWQVVTLVFLGLLMLALYSSYGRPIWFDEFVQYAR